MRPSVTLVITSILSILLFIVHWSYEITVGMEKATMSAFGGIVILVVWSIGVLLAGRRSGNIIMLLGGILGFGVLVIHMMGKGMLGTRILGSNYVFVWVSSLVALGVLSAVSIVLAGYLLWKGGERGRA